MAAILITSNHLPWTPKPSSSPVPPGCLCQKTNKTQFRSFKISSSKRPDPELDKRPDKTRFPVPEKREKEEDEVDSVGVKVALSVLSFYKREISPLIPKSCRYVPSCSEYSMDAYKRYGVVKGTVLTAWRLCRCNPLGGSGFDPPRWFGEEAPPME